MGRERKIVWVVMTNDFPEVVFDNRESAETFCEAGNAEEKRLSKETIRTRIYYRWHEIPLRSYWDPKS